MFWLFTACSHREHNDTLSTSQTATCDKPVIKTQHFSVFRCQQRGLFSLSLPTGDRIDGLSITLQLDDRILSADDWTQAAWRSSQNEASLLLTGNPDGVTATVDIQPDGEQVIMTARVASEKRKTINSIGFSTEGVDAGIYLPVGGAPLAWDQLPGAPQIISGAITRRNEQLVSNRATALYIGRSLDSPALRISLDSPTASTSIRLAVGSIQPQRIDRVNEGRISVLFSHGVTPNETLERVKTGYIRGVPSLTPPSIIWGWRSGPVHGLHLETTTISEAANRLQSWVSDTVPPPTLWLDGVWYSALGIWQWSPYLVDLVDDIEHGLALGGTWPAFRLSDSASNAPPSLNGECQAEPCQLVRVTSSESWSWILNHARDLVDSGVSAVRLVDVPAVDSMYGNDLNALARAFDSRIIGPARHEFLDAIPHLAFHDNELQGIKPCTVRSLFDDDSCRASEGPQVPMSGINRVTTTALQRGWTLAQHWHWSAVSRIDLGPIFVANMEPAEARRNATIGALSGGAYLLGDALETLTKEREDLALAPIRLDAIAPTRPIDNPVGSPPMVWVGDSTVGVINWTDAPLVLRGQANPLSNVARWRDVFSQKMFTADNWSQITIPQGDAMLLKAIHVP